jgi:hypothetical protein
MKKEITKDPQWKTKALLCRTKSFLREIQKQKKLDKSLIAEAAKLDELL